MPGSWPGGGSQVAGDTPGEYAEGPRGFRRRRTEMIWPSVGRRAAEFQEVALVHLDALYRGALRLTRNRAQAEDLVQEALARAFRGFAQFRAGTNCGAGVFTIVRNVFLNHVGHMR